MKTNYFLKLLAVVPCAIFASYAFADTWLTDKDTGCHVLIYGSTTSTEIIKWSGDCVNNKANGKGVLQRNGVTRFKGEYREGKQFGVGTEYYLRTFFEPESEYEGEFENGKQHGNGIRRAKSGTTIEGQFRNGSLTGFGKHSAPAAMWNGKPFYEDAVLIGDKYVTQGMWLDGKFIGTCKDVTDCEVNLIPTIAKQTPSINEILLQGIASYQKDAQVHTQVQSLFLDVRTNLTWRKCALVKVWDERNKECIGNAVKAPWLDMVDLASKDIFGGFDDWRLPTESEITGLVGNSKGVSCRDLLPRVGKFFTQNYYDNPVIYKADHWLLNNSDDMKNPMSMNLRVEAGFACRFMSNDLRAHAPQPAILVRGGVIPEDWKMAISKTPQAQALFNQSKKEGVANMAAENAYMNKVVEQVKDVLSTPPAAATNTNLASNLSKSSGATAIRSETYDNAGRKTEGYWVKCSGGSETRVYRTAWDSNRSWYRPGGGNGYFVADGNISINNVAQRICK